MLIVGIGTFADRIVHAPWTATGFIIVAFLVTDMLLLSYIDPLYGTYPVDIRTCRPLH